ncbi:DNA/RNA non-specific endonuclease [Microbacterium invictum]|uniref:DNA/RNA non-specific endonuclease n=1 Tax=Microbacterium invictum TaxID=515415 RepID=A0ABZ0VBJ9_9MICO|nr:DNA/RNA non-specific endonuclease [Microbacterium invictum]WQB70051.1 DNA/RNA non-specific endonuclease [Microbacterium invictum]
MSGYEPGFLGVEVPLPTRAGGGGRRLDYPRFSVVLDAQRRLAAVTAVNIDGARLLDLPRTGEWRLDPRAPADEQTGPEVYARNDLDRGHLVRRRDPGWGTAAEAREATEATFFYTNAAPQAADFNQSKELWLGLEDHVLAFAEASDQRISVFTAPIFGDDDPPYRGIQVPLRFYKIAAWVGAEALEAAGFVLDQSELVDTRQGVVAVDRLGGFRTFQVPISDIAAATGLDFGPLVDADVLEIAGARAEGWRELGGASDIRWGRG